MITKLKQRFSERKEFICNNNAWIIGLICLYNAIAEIFYNKIAALLFLFLSLMILPPSYNFLVEKFKIKIPVYIKTIAIIVIIFIIVLLIDPIGN